LHAVVLLLMTYVSN